MKDILFSMILAVIFIAVFGAFTDLISAKEAVVVLAVLALPLTLLSKLTD